MCIRKKWVTMVMLLAAAATAWVAPGAAHAQGVTTAAVSGRVVDQDGRPLPAIQVTVTNQATGVSRTVLTNQSGQYLVPGLQVGGPYMIQASGIGWSTRTAQDIQLVLGQNFTQEFQLQPQAVELQGLEVTTERTTAQVINPSRTGAEQLVTEHQLATLPTIGRNFTDFMQLSPLVGAGGGATSVGQQNNRFNNIQIDGALSQDLFGLGSTGQPGGQASARSINMAAVKEYQILVAPFDVRQSGFTGGLINAVTKSGTNEFHGSLSAFYRDENFVRETLEISGSPVTFGEATTRIFGGTLGGPIVRDRVHFFVAGELEADERPSPGIAIGRESPTVTGVDPAVAEQFASLLRQQGVEPGSIGARTVANPNRNLFTRIDALLSNDHSLMLRHNYVRAEDDNVQDRSATGTIYSLESNGYFFESTTHQFVGQLTSTFGRAFNELTFGWNRIRDRRAPEQRYPAIEVRVPNASGSGTKQLRAGAEFFSQGNELDQDSWEITNNLTIEAGDHRLTFGVRDEIFKFRNLFWPGMTGFWTFNSLDAFAAGTPSQFDRNVPFSPGADPTALFTVNQFSLYGQTEWSVRPNFTLTAGLRYDIPFVLDDAIENPLVETEFGRSTADLPSGNGVISPRVGFNWDVYDDKSLQLRGGAGIFTGRHPYVWLSNLYSNTGLSTVSIRCTGAGLPAYTLDPDNQPSTCSGAGTPESPRAAINLIDPDFQYPHNWRFNLGVDKQLPYGIVGTLEFLYSKSRKQIFLRELNVDFDNPVSVTQGGREVYGTHRTGVQTGGNNAIATSNRLSDQFWQAVELTNSDKDRSYSFTVQAQKRYAGGLEMNTSYTYSDAEDVSGLTSSIATSNIGFNPVRGSPNDPQLATSDYQTRHKFLLSGAYDVATWFTWSLFYLGNSGDNYSYTYDGDVNADGYEFFTANNRNNDLLYVPRDANDITLVNPADWTRINAYIEGESCLRENRGTILSRNVCDDPWRHLLNTRFTFKVPTIQAQRAEISLDIINVLNLLNEDWGLNEGVPFQTIDLLELRGWDAANNRGIFQPTSGVRLDDSNRPIPFQVFDPSSRWFMQLGFRYAF